MVEVAATGVDAGQVPRSGGHGDLVPLDQLIRGTPGAHPVTSVGELRNGASGTGEELDTSDRVPVRGPCLSRQRRPSSGVLTSRRDRSGGGSRCGWLPAWRAAALLLTSAGWPGGPGSVTGARVISRCPAAGSPASRSSPVARPWRLERPVGLGDPARAAWPGHRHVGWCLLPCLPAAAGHPGSEGFQGLRRAPRVAAARAIACGGLAHRGGGQRGRGARSRRDSSRACPAARTRERLPGRVPSPVAAACRGWRHGLPPPRVIGTSPGWRADPRSAGWAGRWLPPAARVTSPAVPPSLLTADQPGSGGRVIRGNFGLTADAGGTHGPGSGHYLLCPGTHQGIVRGSREHGSGNDGCGGNGISENDGSCVG